VFAMISAPAFMPRGNRLVELVEGLEQMVAILEVDRMTWSEKDLVDVVDHRLYLS
jgi:hypothetical protein